MHTTLVLTHECNLACTYCYMGEHDARDMPWATVEQGLELAFGGTGDVELGFFGGEPLIRFETLVRATELARARAAAEGRTLRVAVTTNGTLLTTERARTLRALDVQLTLSLDGTRAAHEATRPQRGGRSSFDSVLRGMQAMREAGLPLEVIAVVAPANVRELGASVRYLVEQGARRVVLNPCFEQAWSDDDLAAWETGLREAAVVYAEQMRAGQLVAMPTFDNKLLAAVKGGLADCDSCGAGVHEVAVAPSGNLYPCARMVAEDRDHRLVIGHLDAGIDPSRVRALRRGPADPACGECAEQWRCGAGCACANLAETGTTHLPGGTQCWYEQTSAKIADAIGEQLLAAQVPAFMAWTYGRVATARAEQERNAVARVARRRRLPVLAGPGASVTE